MITDNITLGRAREISQTVSAALTIGMKSPTADLFRVIGHFDCISNSGSDDSPRWTNDRDTSVMIGTFVGRPSAEQVQEAVAKQLRSFQPTAGANKDLATRWTFVRVEIVGNDELCEYEKSTVSTQREVGAYYSSNHEPLWILCGGDQNDGYPRRWAPLSYAVAFAEATNTALEEDIHNAA
ncbi:hypothetical protein ACFONL_22980 [Camelimonas fluminis]|uniref:Uncharacterized protein n=2 Tax=Camelimonas fluminis TaxID=1576911 RepID=A0ABV7UPZ5_9HYPH